MRVCLSVRSVDGGWTVEAFDLTTNTAIVNPATGQPFARSLPRVSGVAGVALPIPPAEETALLPPDADHRDLCAGKDPRAHEELLERIVTRRVRDRDVSRFGSYLFAVLIGSELWQIIKPPPAPEWLELSLSFPSDQRTFTRLPWELMRSPEELLAATPRVSIVRLTRGSAGDAAVSSGSLPPLARLPRVLFVVGTELHRDVIKPGAEYLHLVRGLRAAGADHALQTHLVCRATEQRVRAAMERLRPDVVHFICHGGVDGVHPYLELVHPTHAADVQRIGPDTMVQLLQGDHGDLLPRLVVLSACSTAQETEAGVELPIGQVATPLAARLVEAGVPMVVGMSGPIADQACRLFARQFYQHLATGGDLAHATALGRRAALRGDSSQQGRSVDWAFPTIYAAETLHEPRLQVGLTEADEARLRAWVEPCRGGHFGERPVFCDRLDVLERFDLLLAGPETQRRLSEGRQSFNVLAVDVSSEKGAPGDQFGRSWLLKELAEKACLEGHFPILVSEVDRTRVAKTRDVLLARIAEAGEVLLALIGRPDLQFRHARAVCTLPPDGPAPPNLAAELVANWKQESRYARALRLDLQEIIATLRREARPPDENPPSRIVLLIDDVHCMGEATDFLLNEALLKFGLNQADRDVSVVFSWASKATRGPGGTDHATVGYESSSKIIEAWLKERPTLTKMSVDRFGAVGGIEARLAYEYFLLNSPVRALSWRGVAVASASAPETRAFWSGVGPSLGGVPSRLWQLEAAVEECCREDRALFDLLFRHADDNHLLERIAND